MPWLVGLLDSALPQHHGRGKVASRQCCGHGCVLRSIFIARLRCLVAMTVSKNLLLRSGCKHLGAPLLIALSQLRQVEGMGILARYGA